MKNKIILNILICYFLVLTLVLVIQIFLKKPTVIESLPHDIAKEDRIKNSVIFAIDSPVVIINENQFLIDKKDSTLVPMTKNGKTYIPVKLLETAFGANINFDKQKKQTIVRLNNKAIIFPSNSTNIELIDNTSKETIKIEEKSKIIENRFYIPLRSFANIFEKQVFYNNDLIIISDMENLFDPIEEMDILQKIENQVKQLPIVGNQENLKSLLKSYTKNLKQNTDLINIENIIDIKEKENIMIKKTNNYNIYLTKGFIEVYFVTKDKKEIFSFKVEKENNNVRDIKITDDRFIITYQKEITKTFIYDISNRKDIKILKTLEYNGDIYRTILNKSNLYIISKIDLNQNKNKLPYFSQYLYKNNAPINILEEKFSLSDIFYFPDINDNNYTLISYVNLYSDFKYAKNKAYLGMGDNIVIDDDYIYILTSNKENNNLYKFKANLDDIEYVERKFIKGKFVSLELDKNKYLLKLTLDDKIIYFDNDLNII